MDSYPSVVSRRLLEPFASPCPDCFRVLETHLEPREGEVWYKKTCETHGEHTGRYWDDVDHLKWTDRFGDEPGGKCCGPAKRCVGVVDVTENCNLECRFCFASSAPGLRVKPREEITALLETLLKEAGPCPIQFSGGEPTTRKDLPELAQEAKEMGFPHVMVNSNGVRLAEPGYARTLKDAGVDAVYLQFDGVTDAVYEKIRDVKLWATKKQAVEQCREAGLPIVLVPTIVRGTNDHELGAVIEYALSNLDVVRGIVFQPMARFGRFDHDDGHLSLAGVAKRIAEQSGHLKERDLLPFPCCSPRCASATVLLATKNGAMPITRYVTKGLYRRVLEAVGERHYLDVLAGTETRTLTATAIACGCGVNLPNAVEDLVSRSLVITVQGFMDAQTCDLSRIGDCCIVVPTENGTLAPFCGWNMTDQEGRYVLRDRYRHPQEVVPLG